MITSTQTELLNAMPHDVWYDTDLLQSPVGSQLPDWFYLRHADRNTDHMADIRALIQAGKLAVQERSGQLQVLKPFMPGIPTLK
jgi:hypothetical protein